MDVDALAQLFPHGYCLAWNPWLISLDVIGDFAIWVCYVIIPLAISTAIAHNKAHLLIGEHNFWLWFAFIMSCGFSHLFSIMTIWEPIYYASILMKWITVFASTLTVYKLRVVFK